MEENIKRFLLRNRDFAIKFQAMSTEEQLLAVKILKTLI